MAHEWEADFEAAFTHAGSGDPLRDLSPKQRRFHLNRAFRRKWLGTRRSGKTFGLLAHMLACAPSGETVAYVAPTIATGRRILWPVVRQFGRDYGVRLHVDNGKHRLTAPNGGAIQVYGLSTMPDAELLRGQRFPLAVVDECGHHNQRILEYAVKECISPATLDFLGKGGRGVVLAGTPSKLVDTWWHEQLREGIAGSDPAFHFTTVWDNPFFAGRERHVEDQYCIDNKVTRESAAFKREMLGQFVIDLQALCYSWNGVVLPSSALPTTGMTVMGIDFGYTHPTAWVVVRSVPPNSFACEVREVSGLGIHEIAAITKELRAKWNVGHIVGDSEDARAIHDLNTKFGIPVVRAEKSGRKLDRIGFLDSCLRAGTFFLGEHTLPLQEQLRSVGWNDERDDHHPNQPDHSLDATHYALELAVQVSSPAPPPPPEKGSPEWIEEQRRRAVRLVEARDAAGPMVRGRRRG